MKISQEKTLTFHSIYAFLECAEEVETMWSRDGKTFYNTIAEFKKSGSWESRFPTSACKYYVIRAL